MQCRGVFGDKILRRYELVTEDFWVALQVLSDVNRALWSIATWRALTH